MHTLFYPLFLTLSVQGLVSIGMFAFPVLLPAYAKELGVGAAFAGAATAAVYGGAAITAYFISARVRRIGSIRTCQLALLTIGAGLALAACGGLVTLILGALLLGLGYGPVTAASASLLTRAAPAGSYGMVFSINRVSIPFGAAMAGALLPAMSGWIGWRGVLLCVSGASVLIAAYLQSARSIDHSDTGRPILMPTRNWSAPLLLLFRHPKRRVLTQASLAFLAAQSCLAAFTVAFLVGELSMSYLKAGAVLAVAQSAGVVARLVLGFASDRSRRGILFMGLIGLAIATATCLAAFARTAWADQTVIAVFILYGAGALGWNGTMLAELARTAALEDSGEIAGASSSVAFAGAVVGPAVFSLLLGVTGYRGSFLVLTAAVLLSSILLIRFDLRPPALATGAP